MTFDKILDNNRLWAVRYDGECDNTGGAIKLTRTMQERDHTLQELAKMEQEQLQMKQKTLDYLESHQSETPSGWKSEAEWRRENKAWLRHSQHIAVKVLLFMKREQLTQSSMAQRLGCTQQYVSKILKGKENMSLETLTKLEQTMGVQIIAD